MIVRVVTWVIVNACAVAFLLTGNVEAASSYAAAGFVILAMERRGS